MVDEPRTERGRRTRERIVAAAAALIERQGVEATSLDQVLGEARASKSQLYHYFRDKHDLVRAVIAWQSAAVVGSIADRLAAIESWDDLDRWFDEVVAYHAADGCRVGCPVGTLAAELAQTDEAARGDLAASFEQWERLLRRALENLRRGGLLHPATDAAPLATATLATIQGGLLLAKTSRDPARLRAALTAAGTYLRSYAPR